MEILILGCGVSGLSTGLRLLEAGHRVRIWAKALPPHTTSNVAAAVWYPYRAYPEDKVTAWGAEAYRAFQRLAETPESGVLMADVLDLKPVAVGDPWWVSAVEGFRHARPEELPPGYADGYALAAPVIDTSVYLAYLQRAFEARGGTLFTRTVSDLTEAFAACAVVVNCVGLGARELLGDREIHPARGQVVRVRANGFRRVLLDDTGPNALAYIVPRGEDIVLGGIDEDGSESTALDPATRAGILRRCANLVHHFDAAFAASLRALLTAGERPGAGSAEETVRAEMVSEAAGLRPVRSTVRLERERPAPDRWLIHNYGHGGAGVTLSWGCAAEVVTLVAEIARPA
ncbi:MAG: FAD-binding oxidoreductase [Ktedonobacterales bacterium]|nr:FAD-binding oxidoreductase [Ktedonobacterales bacterium]